MFYVSLTKMKLLIGYKQRSGAELYLIRNKKINKNNDGKRRLTGSSINKTTRIILINSQSDFNQQFYNLQPLIDHLAPL